MIDIFIKSFNRPYYLDRCLESINHFIIGDYRINILDDGTPEKYLTKIQGKYPKVTILKSKNYNQKIQAITDNLEHGKEINGFQIPTDLWRESINNGTDYCIVTEEDVWFTEKIDLKHLVEMMKKYNMPLIKIGWISNRPIISEQIPIPNSDVIRIKPRIFSAPSCIMNYFFENKYKFSSILRKLRIINSNTKNEYWIMNSLLLGLYSKNYWLKIWDNNVNNVNETLQLKNAIQWYRKNKNACFGRLNSLKMNTTFISSATNSYHKYGTDCDINIFNHIMNEEWYADNFDSLQNFPKDISEDYYKKILDDKNDPRCTSHSWMLWAEKFKNQYRNQNVIVD